MCLTDGILRTRIDDELTKPESLEVDNHLNTCADCRRRFETMVERSERVQTLFSALSPSPVEHPSDARIALNRFMAMRKPANYRYPAERTTAVLTACRRFFTSSISIPVPIAAAILIAFSLLFQLALRGQEPLNLQVAQPARLPESPRIVEIPVVREKLVTQTIFIESKREKERKSRSFIVQNLSGSAKNGDLYDSQITGKEFERKLRENERSLLERRTRYLKPGFGDPSYFQDLIIPPVIWQRDMFDNDFLAKPVNKTRLIANQQFNSNTNIRSGIDFSRPKTE